MKKNILIIGISLLVNFQVFSQEASEVDTIVYKKVDTTSLIMKVIYPPVMEKSKKYPAMVFFFGGGWKFGSISQFELQARYFAKRGIVCFLADYRVESRHGTYVKESIMDAKSAIRYIRANAKTFQLDGNKIIASGGSSGGHLAASTAMISGYNDQNDNISISPIPNALVLFNPALDLLLSSAFTKVGDEYKQISPLHNLKEGLPPTIIFHGTADTSVPIESIQYFQVASNRLGNRSELNLYEGQEHGFFNFSRSEDNYKKTVFETDKFLNSLGYLDGVPTIMDEK